MLTTKRVITFYIAALFLFSSFKDREITWLAIGDSITYLNDHTDETANRVSKGYLTNVTELFPGLHYINKGFNGWTSGNIAQQIDSLGLIKADIYSVFLGTNDWWQGRPVGTLEDYKANKNNLTVYASFRIIMNKIRSLNAQAKIFLITPMQRADFVYINDAKNNAFGSYKAKSGQYLEAFANAVDSIAAYENIPVIDLYHNSALSIEKLVNFKRLKDPNTGLYFNYQYPQSTEIPFNPSMDEYPYPKEAINLTYDGLHPSDKGNAIIAEAIVKIFKQFDLPLTYTAPPQNTNMITSDWEKYIDLNAYLKPFWKTGIITDETVQVIKQGDTITAGLLFKAKKILSVKAANYSTAFVKGKDWDCKKGKLTLSSASLVPYFSKDDLIFNQKKEGYSMDSKLPGSFVLFHEGTYFTSRQISVTYIKDKKDLWRGPVPVFAATTLPNTIGRLRNGNSLKIVFYGNSIEAGYNASGFEKVAPFMPAWADMIVYDLKHTYGDNILFVNRSVPGRFASWGRDSVSEKVIAEKPDLVIIGFGMNDGTAKVSPAVYREEIKAIIDAVQQQNKNAEFILIAPMLANPLSNFDGFQSLYKNELDKLQKKGIVVADMTGVHEELLKHKSYQDMTGNNINHPNDYLARWYAQYICGYLVK